MQRARWLRLSTAPLALSLSLLLPACFGDGGEDGAGRASSDAAGGTGGTGALAPIAGTGFGAAPSAGSLAPATGGSGGAGGLAGAAGAAAAGSAAPPANTNVALGGAQDFGAFRAQVDQGIVPRPGTFDAAGFFAEHHTALPPPDCGQRVCLQSMLGVLGNLMNGDNCTMLQLGLNSPIAADASQRPPLRLSVVVDVSGSMGADNKLGFVQQGLELLIDGMQDGDQLALISYSNDANVVAAMGEVRLRRAELRQQVQRLVAGGGTNLAAGLELGYREVLDGYDSGVQNRVILLSDGLATEGVTGTAQIMEMSRAYNSDGIGLSTVGLGIDFNAELMRGLAEQGDGNTYFLESSGAVSEVFTEELSYFTVPVAFDLHMEVTPGPAYTLREAYGSSFFQLGDTGVLEVPSVFLAHRESADDITDDGGRRGGGSALMLELGPTLVADDGSGMTDAVVATVDVSFREPGSGDVVRDSIDVHFPMAPWVTPERGFFDSPDLSIIQKSFVMLNIYVTFEMASANYYARDLAGAVQLIDRVMAGVEDYNDEVQDTDIAFDLELMQDLRDLIASEIPPPPPPQIPADPWPCD